jgi:hypothetical protein
LYRYEAPDNSNSPNPNRRDLFTGTVELSRRE